MLNPHYLAGFFDADGSVGIYRRGGDSWQVVIAIANSGHHGEVICGLLVEQFGGTLTYSNNKKPEHRKTFWFRVNGRNKVESFLLYIRDYVIIKKDQVELCLDFIRWWRQVGRKATAAKAEIAEKYVASCKAMKKAC